MVGSVTLVAALLMQLVVAQVYYPPAPTTTPSAVTTTTATTTLPPDVTTTVAPVMLMNAFMDNIKHVMSMYPPLPYMNAPAGYPVAPNYPPMGNSQYYDAPPPVAPPMPYNNYVPVTPAYGGMPPAPINYGAANNYVATVRPAPYGAMPTNYESSYGAMPTNYGLSYGAMPNNYGSSYAVTPNYGSSYAVTPNYGSSYAVTPNYGSSYGATPNNYGVSYGANNYGSSYGSSGASNIYGIGSRPSGVYYGNGHQQQLPYNYNNGGYYNNQPSYPLNIAYHGPAW